LSRPRGPPPDAGQDAQVIASAVGFSQQFTGGTMAGQNLTTDNIDKFVISLEEAARATGPTGTRFIEPAAGTLARAMSARNHLIFGRRGSGKTSLLQKARAEMLAARRPNAYVDMEKFKGHTYPDVLISVLIETFQNIREWLTEGAIAPANKTTFWRKLRPKRAPLNKPDASLISRQIETYIKELNELLHAYDDAEIERSQSRNASAQQSTRFNARTQQAPVSAGIGAERSTTNSRSDEVRERMRRSKTDFLHRQVIEYQKTLRSVVRLAGENGFILLDDLYYIRRADQADVLDYFHRLFKGTGLWLKIGTIRHRSSWYRHGDPPIGIKLRDDVEEIDLDLSLEKYQTTKSFLLKVAQSIGDEAGVDVRTLMNDGARDRLTLASGGVARDYLSIMRESIAVAREQNAARVGTQAVNQAAGNYESSKRDEFKRDAQEGEPALDAEFQRVKAFCLERRQKNCFLVEKDLDSESYRNIKELVDLRLIHAISARVVVFRRVGRIYEAYMIDISQYSGERKRRNLEMIEFWKKDGQTRLRGTSLIYLERTEN
jgi:Cdc6-like AAA superfamily ATPase